MQYDIIIVTGEYHVDHPSSSTGILVKVLEDKGYTVGIIEKPDWTKKHDFVKLGKPRLFFGVTSGSMDSMLVNYTPLKKKRSEDPYNPYESNIPDRAIIVYCNKLRRYHKNIPIVIGGVEASLRRFTHYDYWDNDLRKGILFDSRADILVYGPGVYQMIEIAERLKNNKDLKQIKGTCIVEKKAPGEFELLPSHKKAKNKEQFCKMQLMFSNQKNLAQKTDTRYTRQYRMHNYTTKELDYYYSLDYSRNIPEKFPEFKPIQFSVVTHWGCFGNCSFCSIALHQGKQIISRSEQNILDEIRRITKHPDFKGNIDDLGGPTANMYGMDCKKNCITHTRITQLLKKARKIPGVKNVFVRSGIRYDLAIKSPEYLEELKHHISGSLKIAPEHTSEHVLKLMNKNHGSLDKFIEAFNKHKKPNQYLKYYFMTAHPGSRIRDARELAEKMKQLENTESVQIFTPTPMSMSTCMYYTGLNPHNLEQVYIPYTYSEKKAQKRILF